jgi:DNA-binding NtrC family response regulator
LARANGGALLLVEPLALPLTDQAALVAALEQASDAAPRLMAVSRWPLSPPLADELHPGLASRLRLLRLTLATTPTPPRQDSAAGGSWGAPPTPQAQERPLAELEREAIVARLEACGWQQQRTADSLGIDRKTLYRKIRAYGLVRPPQG